jgi:hypothetical protein
MTGLNVGQDVLEEEKKEKKCKRCGTMNACGNEKCTNCGHDQFGPCSESIDEKKKRRKKRKVKRKKRKGGKRDGKGASSKGYSLRDWFKGGGWVQAGGKYDGKPCAKQPGQKTKPYCRDPDDRAKLSKKERDKRARKKRKEDPNPDRRGKAKNVRQKKSKRKNESMLTPDFMITLIEQELDSMLNSGELYEHYLIENGTYEDGSPLEENFEFFEVLNEDELEEAVYQGKTVKLNKPTRGDVKKFKVYVNSGRKDKKGRVVAKKVNFGHGGSSARKKGEKTMRIRKSNPKARRNFRKRHNCANPGPKTKARYWSCKKW